MVLGVGVAVERCRTGIVVVVGADTAAYDTVVAFDIVEVGAFDSVETHSLNTHSASVAVASVVGWAFRSCLLQCHC